MADKNEVIRKVGALLDQFDSDLRFARASEYFSFGKLDYAEAVLKEGGQVQGTREHVLLGRIYIEKSDLKAAREHLGKALDIVPDDPEIRAMLKALDEKENPIENHFYKLGILILIIILIILLAQAFIKW